MINFLLDSSRNMKRTVALCYDLLAIPAAIYLAISLRYGYMPPPIDNGVIIATLFTTVIRPSSLSALAFIGPWFVL